jgi:hypothetical protein
MNRLQALLQKKRKMREIPVAYPNKIIAWLKENTFEIPIIEETENHDYIIKN